MKKIVSIIIIAVMLFSFASCSGFVSSYRATMLIKDEKSDYCSATWETLDGTLVLNSSKKSGAHEGDIHYTASLEEGELTVYYSIFLYHKLLSAKNPKASAFGFFAL